MITSGTRVSDTEGNTGTVQGEPEDTFAGPTVTVHLDAEFSHLTVNGRVDVPVSQLTELTEIKNYEHRTDCECECGAVDEDTDPTAAWQHDRHCECSCGAL